MERGMTCAARLKLNKPITSATALARMTRLRIYRPKPAESGPRGTGSPHPAHDQELFMAAINKTRRELPQFSRASVRATHFGQQIHFHFSTNCFQRIAFRRIFVVRKNSPHSHQSFSF